MTTYYGQIYLISGGHPVSVQANAKSPGEAKRMVEAQYAGQFRSWAQQMSISQ